MIDFVVPLIKSMLKGERNGYNLPFNRKLNFFKITKTRQRLLQQITFKLQVKISAGHWGLTFESYTSNDTQFLSRT